MTLSREQQLFPADGQPQAEAAFLEAAPSFRETAVLDELRATDYGRLDARGDVYLDYTGGSVYAQSQLDEHMRQLQESVYGNPHSVNPTSSASTRLVEEARAAVLRYFNAPEGEYECIFTPNATGALRLVGEAYPFTPEGRFLALFDNHNSVNGIREFAHAKGARSAYVPLEAPDLRVADGLLERYLDDAGAAGHNLFAYPAQSNFSGVKPRRSCRRAGSTCRPGSRTSSRSRSTRCSATPPAWGRCSPGALRSSGWSVPGSAVAPWWPRTSRPRWSCRCPATPCSRTGP